FFFPRPAAVIKINRNNPLGRRPWPCGKPCRRRQALPPGPGAASDVVRPVMRAAMKCCRSLCRVALVLVPLSLLVLEGQLDAQKQAPPLPPNPQAPVLNAVAPTGVQRGTTVEVILTGTNLSNPTGAYASFPAKLTIPDDDKNG